MTARDTSGRSAASRFEVQSRDGTALAVWVDGAGPPIVLVHGSIADHTTFEPLVQVLRDHLTTYSVDRRGFGASGDTAPYAIEREFEDVAAVVAAVSARADATVALWGHSYGANVAMGVAARSNHVHRLILYEPSLGLRYPAGSIDAVDRSLDAGDREGAIVRVLVQILELTDEEVAALRLAPSWPVRIAAAHTVPRECRVEEGWVYQPGQFDGITSPTLLLSGSDSTIDMIDATRKAAAAIPGSEIRLLDGHAHFAHKTDPALVTSIIRAFCSR